jgi:hypothetical protein
MESADAYASGDQSKEEYRMRFVASLLVLFVLSWPDLAEATEPFGNTWLVKTKGNWSVPCTFTRDLVIADKDKGTQHTVMLRDLFPDQEFGTEVQLTTAGPKWGHSSFHYILAKGGTEYFCMHCWTGRRVLVNLTAGKVVDPKPLEALFAREEKQRSVAFVAECVKLLNPPGRDLDWQQFYGAILLVIRYQLREAERDLRVIEKYGGGGAYGFFPDRGWGKGLGDDLRGLGHGVSDGRQFARLALRRLGMKPDGYSPHSFEDSKEMVAIPPDTRKTDAAGIKLDGTSRQVYDLLGAPDYIISAVEDGDGPASSRLRWQNAWRYDFDPPDDFSLLLIWDDEGRVRQINKVTPALWRGDELFSNRMTKPVFRADGELDGLLLDSPHFLGKTHTIKRKPLAPEKVSDSVAK